MNSSAKSASNANGFLTGDSSTQQTEETMKDQYKNLWKMKWII